MAEPYCKIQGRDANCEKWLRDRFRDDQPILSLDMNANQSLLKWLRKDPGPTYLVLSGPLGIGKSIFLAQFLERQKTNPEASQPLIIYDFANQTGHCRRDEVVAELLSQLRSVSGSEATKRDAKSIEDQFNQECADFEVKNDKRIWVFLDGIQTWDVAEGAIELLPIPKTCKCVVLIDDSNRRLPVAPGGNKDWHRRDPVDYQNIETEEWLNRELRNRTFISGFKDSFVAALKHYDSFDESKFCLAWDEASKFICGEAPVTLLSIAIVCCDYLGRIGKGKIGLEVVELIKQVANSEPSYLAKQVIEGCINEVKSSWRDKAFKGPEIWKVLGALALAKEPVSISTLKKLGVWQSNDLVDKMLQHSFIRRRETENPRERLLDWAWPVYRDVCNQLLPEEYREQLVEQFAKGCLETLKNRPIDPSFAYACRWTATHLHDVPNDTKLAELLDNPVWLLDRIGHSSPYEAVRDFRFPFRCQKPIPLEKLGVFIVQAAQFLDDCNSERLAAQLLTQLSAFACDDLENYFNRLLRQPHATWLKTISQYPKPIESTESYFDVGVDPVTCAFFDAPSSIVLLGTVCGRVVCVDLRKNAVLCTGMDSENQSNNFSVIGIRRYEARNNPVRYVSVRNDHQLKFWEFRNDESKSKLVTISIRKEPPEGSILREATCCEFVRESNCLVVGCREGWISVWELGDDHYCLKNQFQVTSEGDTCQDVRSVAVLTGADGSILVAGGAWGLKAFTMDGNAVPITWSRDPLEQSVNAVVASDDGSVVWVLHSYSCLKMLKLVDSRPQEVSNSDTYFYLGLQSQGFTNPLLTYLGEEEHVYSVVAVSGKKGLIWIAQFDPNNRAHPAQRPKMLTQDMSEIVCIASAPRQLNQGQLPALLAIGESVGRCWSMSNVIPEEEDNACAAVSCLTECNGYVFGAREDGDVFCWEIQESTPPKLIKKSGKFKSPSCKLQPIVTSLSEQMEDKNRTPEFLVARQDGQIELWTIEEGKLVAKVTIHTNITKPFFLRAWRRDEGRFLIVGSEADDQVAFWSFDRKEEIAKTPCAHTIIKSIDLSNDNSRIAVCSQRGIVHVYAIEGIASLTHLTELPRNKPIAAVCFGKSPDDLLLETINGEFQLYNIETGCEPEPLDGKPRSAIKLTWCDSKEFFLAVSQKSISTISYNDKGEPRYREGKPFNWTNWHSSTARYSAQATTVIISSDMRVRVFETLEDQLRFQEVAALGLMVEPTCCIITECSKHIVIGDKFGGVRFLSRENSNSGISQDSTTTFATGEPNMKAIEKWLKKRAFLEEQEPLISDPAQKFTLLEQMEEAIAKIRELNRGKDEQS